MTARPLFLVVLWCLLESGASLAAGSFAQTPPSKPTFTSAVDVVSVTAVVHDRKGRVVKNLSREDFLVFDSGKPRPIVDFSMDESGPLSLALLFDMSGSMQVASKVEAGRQAARHVLSWLEPAKDEAALFGFDTRLRAVTPFSNDLDRLRGALDEIQPWGQTSLFDAVAEAARRVEERKTVRSAVVVFSDGLDTSSRLTAPQVSGIASAIAVPVYLIAVVSPLDDPRTGAAVDGQGILPVGHLHDLARWTGGDLFVVSSPAQASVMARQLVSELRHQYLLAFEPAGESGWHSLEIRTRDEGLSVRARSGYVAGQVARASQH